MSSGLGFAAPPVLRSQDLHRSSGRLRDSGENSGIDASKQYGQCAHLILVAKTASLERFLVKAPGRCSNARATRMFGQLPLRCLFETLR